MYKPAAKRRWGYFALPILHGDRLVGKLDATADRKASVLRVNAIHEDVKFTRAIAKGVQAELEDLAALARLENIERDRRRAGLGPARPLRLRLARTAIALGGSGTSVSQSACKEGLAGEPGVPPRLIGVPRFELGTSPTRTERATRLRHTPSRPQVSG